MGKRVRAKINNFVGVKTRTPARTKLGRLMRKSKKKDRELE